MEECGKYQRPTHYTWGEEGMKDKSVAWCRCRKACPARCELWARHPDRWGGVELKVSSWMNDGATTTKATQTTEEMYRFSLLTSLSITHFASLPLMNERRRDSGHFGGSETWARSCLCVCCAVRWGSFSSTLLPCFLPSPSTPKTFHCTMHTHKATNEQSQQL